MSPFLTTQPLTVSPDQLLLDPNNYRFHDVTGYKAVANKTRYPEPGVQDRALKLLQDTESFDLASLRESILANGFVPIEQIVVERFDDGSANPAVYLTVEGNRRVAAVKLLLKDHAAGAADIPPEVLASLTALPVVEIIGAPEDRESYQKTLMAIRHVAGIKAWGPYQQAKLVVEMYEGGAGDFGTVAQKIGISAREVGRRYRASKALQQMEDDDEFGEHASPKLYSFFHEAISQPKVRAWLEFSDETYMANNAEARRIFYEILSPREIDDTTLPPKLESGITEIRKLKDIVDKAGPLEILADPNKSFQDAVRAATDETVAEEAGVLEHSLSVALNAMRRPGIDAWSSPTERAKEIWSEIQRVIGSVNRLMGSN
jgi:hypothetical protein